MQERSDIPQPAPPVTKQDKPNLKLYGAMAAIAIIITYLGISLLVKPTDMVTKADFTTNIQNMLKSIEDNNRKVEGQVNGVTSNVNSELSKIGGQISSLNTKIDQQVSRIQDSVTAANAATNAAKGIDSISKKVDSTANSVDTLTGEINKLKVAVSDLTTRLSSAELELTATKNKINNLSTSGVSSTATGVSGLSSLSNVSAWITSFGSSFGMQSSSMPVISFTTNSTGVGTGSFTLYIANSTNRTINNLQLSLALFFADSTGVKQQDLPVTNTISVGGMGSPLWVAQNPGATNMAVFASGLSNNLFNWNFSQNAGTSTYYCTVTVTGAQPNTSFTVYPQIKVVNYQ
jgi:hypothetical protein